MKLIELTEGRVKNAAIDAEFDKSQQRILGWNVLINGKLWVKDGKPVFFKERDSANRAVTAIAQGRGRAAQVVPAKSQ